MARPSIAYLRECFDLSADGVLTWRHRPVTHFACVANAVMVNKQRAGRVAGTPSKGYLVVRIARRLYPAHVIVWSMGSGRWPAQEIDHRDLNGMNNRPDNLREATHGQNAWNRGVSRRNKLGIKGVVKHKSGLYRPRITVDGTKMNLGFFADPHEAGHAYQIAALDLHGEFAHAKSSE